MNTFERLWRTAGIQFVGLTILAYLIYGDLPGIGAPDALSFYHGDRMRILIASVFSGLAVLNLMWFAAALRTTLAMQATTAGARRPPRPAQRSERWPSYSLRWPRRSRTRTPTF